MIALLLACGPASDVPDAPTQGTFRALTYNVAGLPAGLSSSEPERFHPFMPVHFNPYDLVLLQEDFAYHDLLLDGLELPYRSNPKELGDTFVNDGLNRFSSLPLGPLERTSWVQCNGTTDSASDCLADKGFSVGTIALSSELDLTVVNLHADAGSSEADQSTRSVQYQQLSDVLAEIDGPLLVAGDTNLRTRSRPLDQETLSAFLSDNDLTEVEPDADPEEIDRFFWRPGDIELEPSNWRIATEFVTPDGEPLSDHPAIAVDWSWRVSGSEPR